MAIAVTTVRLGELETLLEWRMRVLREVFTLPDDADMSGLRAANETYYREHLADGTHMACFAIDEESGVIMGCGGICYQEEMPSPDNPSGTCGYLMNIYSLPEVRGRGVGRSIVEYLVEDARLRGTGKVYLESSEAARSLYHSMGFLDLHDYMKLG
ncbi:MAG: GNAT family N-acetyltransferase [Actinomycetota bacterium]|nr:GNAT family N-acetyltransferase [Actinomycetota bacterium]